MIPFIEDEVENVTNDDVAVSLFWQQKRLLLAGKFAGGNHIVNYGVVENRGNDFLKTIRFLHSGKIKYAKDLSVDAWAHGKGPDPHWKITILKRISTNSTVLSVRFPYPENYSYLKGPCKPRNYIGTVRENKISVSYPPPPLTPGDLRFREILRKPDLIFNDKIVETADRNFWIQLWRLCMTEITQELNLEPGEARFFAYEIFIPDAAVRHTTHSSQWNTPGPSAHLSGLNTEIKQLKSNIKEFDVSSESIDRFRELVTRLKRGRCEIEEYWLSMLFQGAWSFENIPPVAVYLHGDGGEVAYRSKTWIFKDEDVDFYVMNTFFPNERQLIERVPMSETRESMPLRAHMDLYRSDVGLERPFEYFDKRFRILELKINGLGSLIKKLDQEIVKKEDLQQTEKILVENQKVIQKILREEIDEMRPEIEIEIEQKITKKEASRFWGILEKLSRVVDAIEFAKCVKELLSFLNEHKIIQSVLPLLLSLLIK